MSDELDGRVILLTGASGGIGSVTARCCSSAAPISSPTTATIARAPKPPAPVPPERALLVQADLAAARGDTRALAAGARLARAGRRDRRQRGGRREPSVRRRRRGLGRRLGADASRPTCVAPANLIRAALPHFIERRQRDPDRDLELGGATRLGAAAAHRLRGLEGGAPQPHSVDRPQPHRRRRARLRRRARDRADADVGDLGRGPRRHRRASTRCCRWGDGAARARWPT